MTNGERQRSDHRDARRRPSAIAILADPTCRAIVNALGETPGRTLSVIEMSEHAPESVTPRLVRDRMRTLHRSEIVMQVDAPHPGLPGVPHWTLTASGRDLHRLEALMTRIVSHAASLNASGPAALRERALGLALDGLSDPVVVRIVRALAAQDEPIPPASLEAHCEPVPRRTVYRRLGPLVDSGVVIRRTTRTVPRQTLYSLAETWRPVAAIPVLSAWWQSRHAHAGDPLDPLDLEGLMLGIVPAVRAVRGSDGTLVRWTMTNGTKRSDVRLAIYGDRLRLAAASAEDDVACDISGDQGAWTTALVTDQSDGLTFDGDADRGRSTLNAVRAALLAYVR